MLTPGNMTGVGVGETVTARVSGPPLVFGATENPTAAGNVPPVAPAVMVTPSPGNA